MATPQAKKRSSHADPVEDANATGNKSESGTHGNNVAKPIVLSSKRFNTIINNATTMDKSATQKQLEEQEKYKEQLKAGNDMLVAQFKGNMQRTQEQKMQQMKEQLEKKTQEGKLR